MHVVYVVTTVTRTRVVPGASRTVGSQPTAGWKNEGEIPCPLRPTATHPSMAHVFTVMTRSEVLVKTIVPLIGWPATTRCAARVRWTLTGCAVVSCAVAGAPQPRARTRAAMSPQRSCTLLIVLGPPLRVHE